MLKLTGTRQFESKMGKLVDGARIDEEGQPLQFVKVNGELCYMVPTGPSKDFGGIALAENSPPLTIPHVEDVVLDATGKGTLFKSPKDASVLVKKGNAVVATNDFSVNDKLLVAATLASSVVTVQYTYVPTTEEARHLLGDAPYGGMAANLVGSVARGTRGSYMTSCFDTSFDWTDVMYVKMDKTGFVPGTSSDKIPSVVVKNSPTADNPFLELEISVL